MTPYRTRRAGLSLVEVLVALFIMALGMIALLTLFPLGALQMGQALKDDRCSQAVTAADNYMRSYWKKYNLERRAAGQAVDPLVLAFTNPRDGSYGPPNPPKTAQGTQLMPNLGNAVGLEPSYPVFIDPRGLAGRPALSAFSEERLWVAGRLSGIQPRIPRRSFANVETVLPAAANATFDFNAASPANPVKVDPYRICTMLDDLTYDENASTRRVDAAGAPLPVERQGRYTWGWMLQLPASRDPTTANMTVVVYDNRNPEFPSNDAEQIYGRAAPVSSTVDYTLGSTQVRFNYPAGSAVPNVRAGQWVLDGTQQAQVFSAKAQATINLRLANFYRVTGVEIDETTNTVLLDLQTPIKALPNVAALAAVPGVTHYWGDLYVLKGVAEVFERKPLSPSNQPD